jgi:hypothetical protein
MSEDLSLGDTASCDAPNPTSSNPRVGKSCVAVLELASKRVGSRELSRSARAPRSSNVVAGRPVLRRHGELSSESDGR